MKRILLSAGLIFSSGLIFSQDPLIDSWMFNTTGKAKYNVGSGTVTMNDSADVTKVCYNTTHVYVVAEGLANYVMGPFTGNPNTPSGQNLIWKIKRVPAAASTFTDQPSTGALGVAINGIPLYGISDARSYSSSTGTNTGSGDGLWHSDAWVSEGSTMDANGNGHPQQMGAYHYHANPITLYTDPSTSHSPIIGWALDGYPIYGPYGYTNPTNASSGISRMTSSYQLRSITDRSTLPDGSNSVPAGPAINSTFPLGTYMEDYEYVSGSGTLDEHNGRYCYTPEYPTGTYAYFIATDSNGDPDYPYIIGEQYYGQVSTSDIMGASNATIPSSGMTCMNVNSVNDIIELTDAEFFTVFPNPADQTINISMTNEGKMQVTIFDAVGREIMSTNTGSNSAQFNTSAINAGIYYLQVVNHEKGMVQTEKIIIAH